MFDGNKVVIIFITKIFKIKNFVNIKNVVSNVMVLLLILLKKVETKL